MSKLSCYNGMDSCPGMYTNALDENVRGQSNIMDINSMPVCKQPAPSAPFTSTSDCPLGRIAAATSADRKLCKDLI